jgi:hypothetical protein
VRESYSRRVSTSGYSGTPLPQKLGVRDGSAVAFVNDPGHAEALLSPLPTGASIGLDPAAADVVILFTTSRAELALQLPALGEQIFPDRMVWVAWPKRASRVPTDVTEDVVRELALPLGLVDTKVCAIDATWSGLRLVWRKELRGGTSASRRG